MPTRRARIVERLTVRRRTTSYGEGYGVGVAISICSAYLLSIAARISRGFIPLACMSITSRVTPRQTPQVGAMGSSTTEPSGLTV